VDYEVSRIPDVERRRKVFHLASIARAKQVVSEAVQARAEELERLGFKALDALHIACAEARVLMYCSPPMTECCPKLKNFKTACV